VSQVNIHEAKTHLSRLVERVEQGEEIVIARAGKPVAKLVPVTPRRKPRKLGQLKGKITVAPDWDSDEVNEEIARLFYGGDPPEAAPR
jgi:prevent-host-death family protein